MPSVQCCSSSCFEISTSHPASQGASVGIPASITVFNVIVHLYNIVHFVVLFQKVFFFVFCARTNHLSVVRRIVCVDHGVVHATCCEHHAVTQRRLHRHGRGPSTLSTPIEADRDLRWSFVACHISGIPRLKWWYPLYYCRYSSQRFKYDDGEPGEQTGKE